MYEGYGPVPEGYVYETVPVEYEEFDPVPEE